ncbi:PhnD/SsuA/transferrin family substrate-binding protein [Oceanobacillus sp. 143]|nr:PhnD/SsuA/transferrin family substrate-binding protein [Oceanobacillus sp. 143]
MKKWTSHYSKTLGTLEERLESEGYKVEWNEFQAGPALVEALNADSIDFGRTGNTPPIFAQAANAPFLTVAAGKSKFEGSGILVAEGSSILSLEDLKGKRLVFLKVPVPITLL